MSKCGAFAPTQQAKQQALAPWLAGLAQESPWAQPLMLALISCIMRAALTLQPQMEPLLLAWEAHFLQRLEIFHGRSRPGQSRQNCA